jgi:hypothetical protein
VVVIGSGYSVFFGHFKLFYILVFIKYIYFFFLLSICNYIIRIIDTTKSGQIRSNNGIKKNIHIFQISINCSNI